MHTVGILGAGAMGAGIAQVAATAGWSVQLIDVDLDTATRAIEGVSARLKRSVDKGRIDQETAAATRKRLQASTVSDLSECELFIEAIVEDLDIKVSAMLPVVEVIPNSSIIATNTSSLSVSELGQRLGQAHRTCGMHFFNPAPVMRLVEVVKGSQTNPEYVDRVADIALSWGKQVARCADTPGFIVNRVARPYYLEAFRCLEEGIDGPDAIDDVMKRLGGFRMGPFELTDFIGHDVNTATTRTVWEQWNRPARLTPSFAQEQLVAEGTLGRKTGCGVYDWSGEDPVAVLGPAQECCTVNASVVSAARQFTEGVGQSTAFTDRQSVALTRILSAVINEASWALHDGVADQADIDIAMQAGVNYPHGPFAWAEHIGLDLVAETLSVLNTTTDDGRFVTPPVSN